MNIELKPIILRHHDGAGGGYIDPENLIFTDRRSLGGIHFHSKAESLSLEKATALLRDMGMIDEHDKVVDLRSCGKDDMHINGFAARTVKMNLGIFTNPY